MFLKENVMNRLEFLKSLCVVPFMPSIINSVHTTQKEFNIGDRVVNINLGPRMVGKIVYKIDGKTYQKHRQVSVWDMKYPKLSKKHVYDIELDKPTKICTLYEYMQWSSLSKKECIKAYNDLEKHDIVCITEYDLRLL